MAQTVAAGLIQNVKASENSLQANGMKRELAEAAPGHLTQQGYLFTD